MLSMDIAHPDVEDFITIKQDLQKVTGANISIRLSDEFMKAVDNNTEYTHRWPIDSDNPKFSKTIKAKELWDTIIKCAHNTAEPGLIFGTDNIGILHLPFILDMKTLLLILVLKLQCKEEIVAD